MLSSPLPALHDKEGDKIPSSFPFVVDTHVHIFPDGIFKAIWKWFDQYGWPIRYCLNSREILDFLLSRGIDHIIAFQYSHKKGIARDLNKYMVEICSKYPGQVTGMATVFPGEPEAAGILKDAFESGLKGVKLHAHVQCFDMNSDQMDIIYKVCTANGKPIVMHVGKEPKSPAYNCDPYLLCSAGKLENVIKKYPDLKVCVPHLGINEIEPYQQLIKKYDNLWLDTAMALANYFTDMNPPRLDAMRIDRIMYGSDFPNIPYAWDRELKLIDRANLTEKTLELIMGKNAVDFFLIE